MNNETTLKILLCSSIFLLLVFPSLFLVPQRAIAPSNTSSLLLNRTAPTFNMLSFQQQPLPSWFKLGYGPSSLEPINEQIPVYTINDEMWVESNYNQTVTITLSGPQGQLASSTVQPKTISQIYAFNSTLPTSNLNVTITIPNLFPQLVFSIPVQFVNPSSNEIGSLDASYSINNATLSASFSSPNLSQEFDVEACLSNASSSNAAEILLPSSFGSGVIGVIVNPNTTSASLVLQNAKPSSPFSFSFELFTNYTYVLSSVSGSIPEYVNSEIEVAASPNSILLQNSGLSTIVNMTLSNLAAFRSGRYILKTFFQDANGITEVDTRVLITSPNQNSWFWLGQCQELSEANASTFTAQANLIGSPSTWPKYLYLMYQVLPGIEGFFNASLGLNLDRVSFKTNGNPGLPSDIQLSLLPSSLNSAVLSVGIDKNGEAYLIMNTTNNAYPFSLIFALSFGGKTFSTPYVNLESPYQDASYDVTLGQISVIASEGGKALQNTSVTISSPSSGSSFSTLTGRFGTANVFVPLGNYTVTVNDGSRIKTFNVLVTSGSDYGVNASFPGQINLVPYLVWVVAIITGLGAIGNLWFWFVRRRFHRFLQR